MKLKEWMEFNRPFFACDFKVGLFPYKTYVKPLLETVVSWDVCCNIFGEYTLARVGIDKYPKSESACFKLVLWDKPTNQMIDNG